jgi:uncharacterized protein
MLMMLNQEFTEIWMYLLVSMRNLYVHRPLINGEDLARWAKAQGFETTLDTNDMHVTIAYSKSLLDWDKVPKIVDHTIRIPRGINRIVSPLGDKGAVVLKFKSSTLSNRWQEIKDAGASWDYPTYQAHTTISYSGNKIDLNTVVPYFGELVFGPEVWEELDNNWEDKIKEK